MSHLLQSPPQRRKIGPRQKPAAPKEEKRPVLEVIAQEVNHTVNSGGSDTFLAGIFASIQDGICVIDHHLKIVQTNPTMAKWYAHAGPLPGQYCYQAYHGLSQPCRPCPAHRTLMTGKPHFENMALRGANGATQGWLEVYSFPWRDPKTGKLQGVIKYVRDITYRLQVEEAVEESLEKLRKTLNGTVSALSSVLEIRDPYTAGHQRRVVQLACAIARNLGLSQHLLDGLRVMGFLHDIGKMAVPAEILCKPSALNKYEINIIRAHPQVAYDILKDIEFPWPVAQAVYQHHERLDGTGYPSGLAGKEIILEAKILAVADVTEAIASHRPYRPALGIDKALEEIERHAGTLYDPKVAQSCLQIFAEKKFNFDD